MQTFESLLSYLPATPLYRGPSGGSEVAPAAPTLCLLCVQSPLGSFCPPLLTFCMQETQEVSLKVTPVGLIQY